jgi:hypothetical protein
MTKTIKLGENYVPQSSNRSTGFIKRPKLTITGKWLEQAGFLPSEFINIEVEFGKLVITTKQ